MKTESIKRPRMSLEKYLDKEYGKLFTKYKKLVLAMDECAVFEITQFEKGLERVTERDINMLEEDARAFWGRIDVQKACTNISAWRLRQQLREEVEAARFQKKVNLLRATSNAEHPAPKDSPIEVLIVSEELAAFFKKKEITQLRQVTTQTKETTKSAYGFTSAAIDELEEALKQVGQAFWSF